MQRSVFHGWSPVYSRRGYQHLMLLNDPRWCAKLAAGRLAAEAGRANVQVAEQPEADRAVADRADFDPNYDPARAIVCEVCGSEMRYVASCKILCSNCGYRRDCSDP
jgi:hypothetical protein